MDDNELTLEELSERTGVEPRTLRSWVSEGLLAPPFKPGRGARYPASNADRALAVRALKDVHGLSFAEIGKKFMMASEEQIRAWALEAGPTLPSSESARDYLRRIGEAQSPARVRESSDDLFRSDARMASFERASFELPRERFEKGRFLRSRALRKDTDLAAIEQLVLQLARVLEAPAPRRSRGSIWTRISVTPDLELSVRGDLEPGERALFEQLADHIRAILTGRARND
ncbi:helix-turn-helix domain-containing protein [Erythrobacter sp.]|uniref:helix-turn-helix domain-containing protein n=1 Tax=Erythrobacter sp. TaxID=1042 RepID=UPI001425F61C|nr:helix-turn-helix domain-containing protein [Erythrobacter sp.]QIQ85712.1 MAG: MerR family transcriptional regulator [Erythrobacter sp.]